MEPILSPLKTRKRGANLACVPMHRHFIDGVMHQERDACLAERACDGQRTLGRNAVLGENGFAIDLRA